MFISFLILKIVVSWVESVKIPASKMAAIKQSPLPPPPPLSFCEGPRILQNLRDVVFQILELPLYILSFLVVPRRWSGRGRMKGGRVRGVEAERGESEGENQSGPSWRGRCGGGGVGGVEARPQATLLARGCVSGLLYWLAVCISLSPPPLGDQEG